MPVTALNPITSVDEVASYIVESVRLRTAKTSEEAYRRNALLTPLVVLLREEGGLTYEAIARQVGTAEATVRHVYRCWTEGTFAPRKP